MLKRINVVIGPQSAGKSCILKIACFCAWAEKRIQLEQGKNDFADFEYVKKEKKNIEVDIDIPVCTFKRKQIRKPLVEYEEEAGEEV